MGNTVIKSGISLPMEKYRQKEEIEKLQNEIERLEFQSSITTQNLKILSEIGGPKIGIDYTKSPNWPLL